MKPINAEMTVDKHEVVLANTSEPVAETDCMLEWTPELTPGKDERYWESQGLPIPGTRRHSGSTGIAAWWDTAPLEIQEELLRHTLLAEDLRSQRMELIVHIFLASERAAQALMHPLQERVQCLEAVLASYSADERADLEIPLCTNTICTSYAAVERTNSEIPLWIRTICGMYTDVQADDNEALTRLMKQEAVLMLREKAELTCIFDAVDQAELTALDGSDKLKASWGIAQLPTNLRWIATVEIAGCIKAVVAVLVDNCPTSDLKKEYHYQQLSEFTTGEHPTRAADLHAIRLRYSQF